MMGLKLFAPMPIALLAWFVIAAHTAGVSYSETIAYGLLTMMLGILVVYLVFRRHAAARDRVGSMWRAIRRHAAIFSFAALAIISWADIHANDVSQRDISRQQRVTDALAKKNANTAALYVKVLAIA